MMNSFSLDQVLPKTKIRSSINKDFARWIEEHLGSKYVGTGYSTVQEMFDNPITKMSGGIGGTAGMFNRPESFRQRSLREKGLLDDSGMVWDQAAVADEWKKEKASEKNAVIESSRQEALNKVKGTLPDISSFMKNDPADPGTTKNASYWKEYYGLPEEMRGIMQPGVKKAYYDIVQKALKNAGL